MDADWFEEILGFDWDKGNIEKNWLSHGVSAGECEQVFFNIPLILAPTEKHPGTEERHYVLGRTDAGRQLFVVFTIRKKKIRVISARDQSKKERKVYGS